MTDKKIPYLLALSPILFLIVLLSFNVVMYDDAIGGSNQLALLFSGALAAIIGIYYGSKCHHACDRQNTQSSILLEG